MVYKIKKYIYVEKHTSKFLSIPHTSENKKVKFFKENYVLKQSDKVSLKTKFTHRYGLCASLFPSLSLLFNTVNPLS